VCDAPEPRRGLSRVLDTCELDTFFRVRAELETMAFGVADVELLVPYLSKIVGAHRVERGNGADGVGGVIDVGANIGAATDAILQSWSDLPMRVYNHVNGGKDGLHPVYEHQKLPFVYALEASPATRELLQRRADYLQWAQANFRLMPLAAGNTSGPAHFCTPAAGSGAGALAAGDEKAALVAGGAKIDTAKYVCSEVTVARLDDLVDEEAGPDARVFFLKIDTEGAEALVLAGAERLFAAQRVAYVLFENHAQWHPTQASARPEPLRASHHPPASYPLLSNPCATLIAAPQEALGIPEERFISVGAVVRGLAVHGYRCFYVHPRGLLPFEAEGTPTGDAWRTDCHEGLPFCARHRLYNRAFWSNILCGAASEGVWLDWLMDAMTSPTDTRETLLKRPGT
jgi:hypothetical protein